MTTEPQQTFIPQTLTQLTAAVEAVLFVHTEPVTMRQLVQWTGWEHDRVEAAVELLERHLQAEERGLRLLRVAGGVQLTTKASCQPVLQRVTGPRPPAPLSRAALETLAVVAYCQPVTRAEIDRLRGVRSQGALYALQDRELVEEAARAELPGRPILYRTTEKFLHWCGLSSLDDLPPLPDAEPEPGDAAAALLESAAAAEDASSADGDGEGA